MSALTLMLPILGMSFFFLYVYYKYCHPWLKEGVSVGFEPMDQEMWKYSSATSAGIEIIHSPLLWPQSVCFQKNLELGERARGTTTLTLTPSIFNRYLA